MNHRAHRERIQRAQREDKKKNIGKSSIIKEWIEVSVYVNIWNEESKDVYRDTVSNRTITIQHCLIRKYFKNKQSRCVPELYIFE